MRPAEIRVCPKCGDGWPTRDQEPAGDVCPTCRQKITLSRRVGGLLPGEKAQPRTAPPPSLEDQA